MLHHQYIPYGSLYNVSAERARDVIYCSRMVYPVASREEGGGEGGDESNGTMSGKYEPLVHMNTVLTEETKKTMADIAARECLMYSIINFVDLFTKVETGTLLVPVNLLCMIVYIILCVI